MHNRHCDVIKDNLFKLICKKDGKEEEIFVKLLMVYFMTTVFFGNTTLNAPTFIARYTDDFTSYNHYIWANNIHRWLMADIPKMVECVQL